jgi:NADPH:quinone reductase
MKAAWYEKQGPAREVLNVGEMPDPAAGEVRIHVAVSGINPGDVKKRQDAFDYGMPYPRIIPHSDGAGSVDEVGEGVAPGWLGQPVWCYGAQTYRPFGTAAEFTDHRTQQNYFRAASPEPIQTDNMEIEPPSTPSTGNVMFSPGC